MEYQTVSVDSKEGVALLKINRPKFLNALNSEVLTELKTLFSELRTEDSVRAVVLTGEGEKAFVAGADIAAMQGMPALEAKRFCELGHQTMRAIESFPCPVLAAVNGFCLGGGLELALACDFIYASESAKLGLPEVNLGIFPGFGGTQRLPRLIGKNRAKELIYTAKMLSAHEAYEWGLVNRVCKPETLLAQAEATAREMLQKGPLGIALAKQAVEEGDGLHLKNGLALERALFPLVFATEDQKEGVTAFLEKRKPVFKGK